MAILAGKWAALRRSALPALLAASLFLMACGAMGGGNSADPAPAFMNAPGTAATQDSAYAYQITTSPESATLALTGAPAGATLSGNTVTWTPSAAQSRAANQFVVTATSSAGSTTQSWSVMPTGTVSGTWVDTYWTPSGPVPAPYDWTRVPPFPRALVPQADGSFQIVQGSGNTDGTFSIPGISGGYYWFQPAPSTSYWTSSSAIDFGADFSGQPAPSTTTTGTTTVNVTFEGLDPLQAQDELVFSGNGPGLLATNLQPAGATTFTATAGSIIDIDFSQPRPAYLMQYEPETVGTLSALALGPELTLPSVAFTNGTSNSITETLAPSPQTSFDLNVKGSAWPALFTNVGPAAATTEGADLEVAALPFMTGGNILPSSNFGVGGVPLLFDTQASSQQTSPPINGFLPGTVFTSLLLSTPVCGVSTATPPGFVTLLPGEPPITADQDFGPVQYGDPFPSAWPRVFTFCETASVPVPIPNSATPVSFQLVDRQSVSPPTSQMSPPIGHVQNPMINGTSLFAASTVSATGITLSWTAPIGGTPTGYEIVLFTATALPIGVWTYSSGVLGPAFYTTKTSVALPPLQAGQTYVFLINTILDGAANFETSPNRSALPTASASVVSAPITTQ